MFVGHVVGIVHQFGEVIFAYFFVADIDLYAKTGNVDFVPVRIFRFVFKKGSVLYDVCIHGVFKSIGIAGLIEYFVFMFWEIDLKVSLPFRGVRTVTGYYLKK